MVLVALERWPSVGKSPVVRSFWGDLRSSSALFLIHHSMSALLIGV